MVPLGSLTDEVDKVLACHQVDSWFGVHHVVSTRKLTASLHLKNFWLEYLLTYMDPMGMFFFLSEKKPSRKPTAKFTPETHGAGVNEISLLGARPLVEGKLLVPGTVSKFTDSDRDGSHSENTFDLEIMLRNMSKVIPGTPNTGTPLW